jgi:hypothetical protein
MTDIIVFERNASGFFQAKRRYAHIRPGKTGGTQHQENAAQEVFVHAHTFAERTRAIN